MIGIVKIFLMAMKLLPSKIFKFINYHELIRKLNMKKLRIRDRIIGNYELILLIFVTVIYSKACDTKLLRITLFGSINDNNQFKLLEVK